MGYDHGHVLKQVKALDSDKYEAIGYLHEDNAVQYAIFKKDQAAPLWRWDDPEPYSAEEYPNFEEAFSSPPAEVVEKWQEITGEKSVAPGKDDLNELQKSYPNMITNGQPKNKDYMVEVERNYGSYTLYSKYDKETKEVFYELHDPQFGGVLWTSDKYPYTITDVPDEVKKSWENIIGIPFDKTPEEKDRDKEKVHDFTNKFDRVINDGISSEDFDKMWSNEDSEVNETDIWSSIAKMRENGESDSDIISSIVTIYEIPQEKAEELLNKHKQGFGKKAEFDPSEGHQSFWIWPDGEVVALEPGQEHSEYEGNLDKLEEITGEYFDFNVGDNDDRRSLAEQLVQNGAIRIFVSPREVAVITQGVTDKYLYKIQEFIIDERLANREDGIIWEDRNAGWSRRAPMKEFMSLDHVIELNSPVWAAKHADMNPENWQDAYSKGTPHWATDLDPSMFAQQFAEDLVEEFGQDVKLLEIGCGNGRDSILFSRAGFDVTAIDVAPGAVELANKNANEAETKINVMEANAESLPFGSEEFDAVFSISVLHSSDLDKSISEIARVLKPFGTFMGYIYGDTSTITGEKEDYISIDEYITLLKNNNFAIEDFYTLPEEEYDTYGEKHLILVSLVRKGSDEQLRA